MLRLNRAVLAAFLCAAGPVPTGICDLRYQMSPFSAAEWTTLANSDVKMPRTVAAPNTLPSVSQMADEISHFASGSKSNRTSKQIGLRRHQRRRPLSSM